MAIDKERRRRADHARYLRQREAFLQRAKEWAADNPERRLVIEERKWKALKGNRERYSRYLNGRALGQKQKRILVLEHYSRGGIAHCECCGEDRIEFLSIDHKAGDGAAHRREIGHGRGNNICNWIIRNGFPPLFRVLCMNCNCARGHYGYCPHDDTEEVSTRPI